MFATSVRVRPCSARSSPRSVGRVTTSCSSCFSIWIRTGTCCVSSPSGPFTCTRPGESATFTPAGSSIGLFPILDIALSLPDETDDLAADALLLGGAARDDSGGGGQDRRAHAAEHARHAVLARVDAPARLGHALQVGQDPLAAAAVLQMHDEAVEA